MPTICNKQPERMYSLNPRNVRRYETVIKVRYICDICGHQIYGSQAFKKHLKCCQNLSAISCLTEGDYDSDDMIAAPISQYKYVCFHCAFQTNFKSSMQNHIFSHDRFCPFCVTSHQSKTELFKHLEEDHYNLQLAEVNKVLDAKDIGKSGIRLNKQVVNLVELMSTTLSVDASESWNQDEPSFSYLDKLKAIDQDIHEELDGPSLFDRFGTSSGYHPIQRTGSHQAFSQRLFKIDSSRVKTNHCEERALDPEVLISSLDMPRKVAEGIINKLLDRVANIVRCNEMLKTDDDSIDIDDDDLSYGTESDDSELYTTSDTSHTVITLSDTSSDEDYHDTSYTVQPSSHRQRFKRNQPLKHKLKPQRQINVGIKYSSCSKPLQGIKSLARNPLSQRLTGTESKTTIKFFPDVIIELDSEQEQSCSISEAKSTKHKDTARDNTAAMDKRNENVALEKRKETEEDRELIAGIFADDDEDLLVKSNSGKQDEAVSENRIESGKENQALSTRENNTKSTNDNQRKSTKEVLKKTTKENQIKSKRNQIKSVRTYQYKSDDKSQPKPKKSKKQTMQFDLQDTLNKAVDNFRSVGNLNKAICYNVNDDVIGVDNIKVNNDKGIIGSGCAKPKFISSVDDPLQIDNAATSPHVDKDSTVQNASPVQNDSLVQNAMLMQVTDDYDEMKELENFMKAQNISPVGSKSEQMDKKDKGLPFKKRSSTGNYHERPKVTEENFNSPIISNSKKLKTCSSTQKIASPKNILSVSDKSNQSKSAKPKLYNIQNCRNQKLAKTKEPAKKPQTLPLKKRAIVEPVTCSSKPVTSTTGSRQRVKSKRLSYEKALPRSLRTTKSPLLSVQFVSDLWIPPIKRLKDNK